jgi:hypothetical protein
MTSQFEQLLFFTKFLTGLILVLNIGLIISIRHNLRLIRYTNALEETSGPLASELRPGSPIRALTVLVFLVIAINTMAVYGNVRLLDSVKRVTTEFSSLDDLAQIKDGK